MSPHYVLGLSAYYHDSAAAIVRDGLPVAAAQQERFSRVRHDSSFPRQAIASCLDAESIALDDLTAVVFYEDSREKLARVLSSFASAGIGGASTFARVFPDWLRWKRNVPRRIDAELAALGLGCAPPTISTRHHRAHAASAFLPSPFERAAVLCIDGVGEWQTTTIWHGRGTEMELLDAISYPHSLGLLYSAFTYYCGFKVDSGEYKLMGLAPYGSPRYADLIRAELVYRRDDGSFTLNMDYFEFLQGKRMVGTAFERLFEGPIRPPESELTQRECDLAASVQLVTEEVVLGLAARAAERTGEQTLCLAGGVALNCVANGVLSRSGLFDATWVQPAAGDAGGALGAALDHAAPRYGRPHLRPGGDARPGQRTRTRPDAMAGALLGPRYSNADIGAFLRRNGHYAQQLDDDELYEELAERLANGAVVGFFQGRMEFGPRALGARSIVGDPRDPDMQRRMNLKIKYRESFRPFAPAVLEEDAADHFDVREESPYMLIVSDVVDAIRVEGEQRSSRGLGTINHVRSELPAITHVDMSARVQTVAEERHPEFARLLRAFKARTGCPVLVNTSFNVRGEPIVRSPQEAYTCFMRTEMDVLALGNYLVERVHQEPVGDAVDWREAIPLD